MERKSETEHLHLLLACRITYKFNSTTEKAIQFFIFLSFQLNPVLNSDLTNSGLEFWQ